MFQESNKSLKMPRLDPKGNYYSWETHLKLHFKTLGYYDHVFNNTPFEDQVVQVVENAQEEAGNQNNVDNAQEGAGNQNNIGEEGVLAAPLRVTIEMKEARCKRDVILSLSEEILLLVKHSGTAHGMVQRVKRMFVGTQSSQRRKLEDKFLYLKFNGNYFVFMNESQGIFSELENINGIRSYSDLTLRWLKKFPNNLSAQTYPETIQLETLMQNEDDGTMATFQNVFDRLLDYLMALGLYDVTRVTQSMEEEKTALNSKKRKTVLGK